MREREDFFGCRYDAADDLHERSLPVRENIAPSILKSTSEKLLAAVFPDCGKVFGKAASVLRCFAKVNAPLALRGFVQWGRGWD